MGVKVEAMLEARDVITGLEWFIAAIAAVGTIVMAVKKVYRLARNVETSLEKMDKLQKQFEPNGGESMYDKMNLLMQHVKENAARAAAVDNKIDDLNARVANLERYHMEKHEHEERHKE